MPNKNKENRERAIAAIKEVAEKKAAPYVKKASKKLQHKVIKKTGISKKGMARALALAELVRSGKLKGRATIGKNTKLRGEIDLKNKSIKAGLDYDF